MFEFESKPERHRRLYLTERTAHNFLGIKREIEDIMKETIGLKKEMSQEDFVKGIVRCKDILVAAATYDPDTWQLFGPDRKMISGAKTDILVALIDKEIEQA